MVQRESVDVKDARKDSNHAVDLRRIAAADAKHEQQLEDINYPVDEED